MINLNDLKNTTPSVFATSASPKMSDRYVFVPTLDILENFEREGWQLGSAKQVGKGLHSVHELRLRNGQLPKVGDTLVEAVIRNSHNGMATFRVSADTLAAAAVFIASINELATGTDGLTARPFWEIIDNTQTANWVAVATN